MNWTELLRKAGLEAPGYEDAVKRAKVRWEEHKNRRRKGKKK